MADQFIGWTLAEAIRRTTGADRPEAGAAKFWTFVSGGQLRLFGKTIDHPAHRFIPPNDCEALELRDYAASSLAGVDARHPSYRGVQVYPTVHAPDISTVLDGMALRDAFNRFVVEDPELVLAQAAAKEIDPEYWNIERFAGAWHGRWRLDFETQDWLRKPENAGKWARLDPRKYRPEVRSAQDVLYRRLFALFGQLSTGKIEAVGDPARTRDSSSILPTIWSHRDYFFVPKTGDVFQETDDEYPRLRWRAIYLRRPSLEQAVPVHLHAQGEWRENERLTTGEQVILAALRAEFPSGLKGVPAGARSDRLNDYVRKTTRRTAGYCEATIKRCLAKITFVTANEPH